MSEFWNYKEKNLTTVHNRKSVIAKEGHDGLGKYQHLGMNWQVNYLSGYRKYILKICCSSICWINWLFLYEKEFVHIPHTPRIVHEFLRNYQINVFTFKLLWKSIIISKYLLQKIFCCEEQFIQCPQKPIVRYTTWER